MNFSNEKKTSSARTLRNGFWNLIAFLLIQSFHSFFYVHSIEKILNSLKTDWLKSAGNSCGKNCSWALLWFSLFFINRFHCMLLLVFVCCVRSPFRLTLHKFPNATTFRATTTKKTHTCVPTSFQSKWLTIFRPQKSGEQIRTFNSPWKTYYILNLRKSN